ncbi:hypothetical protein HAX54_042519 [Datura stramonium]|uniref:Uncharacterized protein n=1 Tax=Datura stramonium TaxID=4076 RepID=A0ABS8SNF2_DATST|nr:hypothetical protein [Datura stramonium]
MIIDAQTGGSPAFIGYRLYAQIQRREALALQRNQMSEALALLRYQMRNAAFVLRDSMREAPVSLHESVRDAAQPLQRYNRRKAPFHQRDALAVRQGYSHGQNCYPSSTRKRSSKSK